MKRLAINSGDAFILVYSVDNPDSFGELEQLRETILSEREQAYLEASGSLASCSNAVSLSQSSGLASTSSGCCSQSQNSVLSQQINNNNNNKILRDGPGKDDVSALNLPQMAPSPSRHWSLGSLFHHQQHTSSTTTSTNNNNVNGNNNYSHNTSLSSSICSSTCSSTDTSRRSSVSAAEAALRTRRTRRPPMVIVANKYDLPHDQHLVNSDEIEALAVIDWNNGFVRASAALNTNIDEIFQQVLKQARQPSTLAEAILSKRRKSLPPKLPH